MVDMCIFNVVMGLLNIYHAVVLVYKKCWIEFSEELEQIYTTLFSRYISRVQFKNLADIAVLRQMKAGVIMKEEGDFVTSLCIIVKGQVDVKRRGRLINVLYENEILEAPDWVRTNLNPDGRRFDVSFVTTTEVIYIKLARELLVGVLEKNDDIRSAVLAVLSIGVSEIWLRGVHRKLSGESMLTRSSLEGKTSQNQELSLHLRKKSVLWNNRFSVANYLEIKPESSA